MTCPTTRSLLEQLVDNELPPAAAEQLRAHLASCSDCRSDFESSRQLKELLSKVPVPDPGDRYWNGSEQIILARTVDRPSEMERVPVTTGTSIGTSQLTRSLVALAASLLLLCTAVWLGSAYHPEQRPYAQTERFLVTTAAERSLTPRQANLASNENHLIMARATFAIGGPGPTGRLTMTADLWLVGSR